MVRFRPAGILTALEEPRVSIQQVFRRIDGQEKMVSKNVIGSVKNQ